MAKSTTLNDETTTSATGDAGGGGQNTAGGDTNGAATSPVNNSQTKKKVTQSQYEVSKISSNTLLNAGGIKRLTAAVFIAQKMEGEGKERKPVLRTDEELQKLKRMVQSAVGIVENDPVRKDEITLEQLPFNDQPAIELSQRLETDGNRQFYWEVGRNILFPAVALILLMVFLKLLKKTNSSDIPVNLTGDGAVGAYGAAQVGGEGDSGNWRKESKPGVVTVEVLNALIKENPANMTQAVRSWLTTGNKSN